MRRRARARSARRPWRWRGCGATCQEDLDALPQEHRARVHLGATPRDVNQGRADTLTYTPKRIAELGEKHGGADHASWRWGDGTPCSDPFAADDARRKYESLKAKAAALQQVPDGVVGSGARRERSPSPTQPAEPREHVGVYHFGAAQCWGRGRRPAWRRAAARKYRDEGSRNHRARPRAANIPSAR